MTSLFRRPSVAAWLPAGTVSMKTPTAKPRPTKENSPAHRFSMVAPRQVAVVIQSRVPPSVLTGLLPTFPNGGVAAWARSQGVVTPYCSVAGAGRLMMPSAVAGELGPSAKLPLVGSTKLGLPAAEWLSV